MEKQTKKDYKLLIILILIVLLGVAVGYAALSQKLTINGTANISSEWNVKFKSITAKTIQGATEAEATPSKDSDTSVTFEVTLEKPGSYAEYEVVVENAGTLKAKLKSITDLATVNVAEPTDIKYTVTGPEVDSILESGKTATYTVKVEWLSTSEEIPTVKSKTATIELNYEQAE